MNLKVVSFNILCVDAPNGNKAYSLSARAPRICTVVASRNPDLIGFQEATPAWLEFLKRDYGETYEIYNVYRSKVSPESTPIAWNKEKFECLDKGNFWFSDTPEVESRGWDELYDCPRIFTWAKLKEKASGKAFCFINTHFGFGDSCQIKSSRMLVDFARKMELPCVITGDFNLEISSLGYRELTQFLEDVNAQTVNDLGPTYHGFYPDNLGEHIDYCFITPDIHPLAFQVLRDLVEGEYPSDHYALFSSLEL